MINEKLLLCLYGDIVNKITLISFLVIEKVGMLVDKFIIVNIKENWVIVWFLIIIVNLFGLRNVL